MRDSIRKYVQYTILALIMISLPASCVHETDVNVNFEKEEVRIVTAISMSLSGFSAGNTRGITGEIDDESYSAGTENETAADRKITTIRVFAFLGEEPVLNQIYAETASTGVKAFAIDGQNYLLDMELLSALYEFVLIANEDQAWDLGSVSSKTELTEKTEMLNYINPIISSNSTQLTDIGIPMIGKASINVPSNLAYTATDRWVAQPIIQLERTIAKVQVNLTNIDPATTAVYPGALGLQIKSVSLKNVNQIYNVYNSGAISTPETGATISGNAISHTAGAPFANQMVLEAYMAERFSPGADEAESTYVEIIVTRNNEDVTYSIPIYQTDNGQITGTKNYNIFRNHLYRLNCRLEGTDMSVEIYYSIGDWNVEEKSLFLGMGYQLELLDGQLTVTNTIPACDPHKITMKPLNGTTLTKGGTTYTEANPAIFQELLKDATASYTIDNNAVSPGSVYLEIYYNDILVKSYTK